MKVLVPPLPQTEPRTEPDERPIDLSVVLKVVGGRSFVRRGLDRLMPQLAQASIEILVPFDNSEADMADLAGEYPGVRFLDLGELTPAGSAHRPTAHERYDLRASAGLREARGRIIAMLEDYGAPAEDWCRQILTAHREPHGVIGGVVEQSAPGLWNWAVYFLDFGRYQPPLPEGPSRYLTDINVSYKREVLQSNREWWADRYNEVTLHWALLRQGVVLWQRPQMVVHEDRGQLTFGKLLRERFAWGRLFAATRTKEISPAMRGIYILLSPLIPVVMIARRATSALILGRKRRRFLCVLPQYVALTLAWCCGELAGYVTGREGTQ